MKTISISYGLLWQHSQHNNYQFTRCKKCFNTKTGKQMKMTKCGGSIGFCINGKFESLSKIREQLIKIPEQKICPFGSSKY